MGKNQFHPDTDEDILDPADIVVTLDLDDGSSVDCEIVTIFDVRNQGEVYLYRYFEDDEGNPSLDNIEDDEEFEIVSDRFDEIQDEEAFEEM